MAPIGSPETLVSNRLALRNDPEDGRTRPGWVFQISLHRRTTSWRHWMTRLTGSDDKRGYSIGKAGHTAWVEKSFVILDSLHVLEAGQDGKHTHLVLYTGNDYVWRYRGLPLQFTKTLPSSGLLRMVGWLSTDVWPVKMEPIGCPETSVLNQSKLPNNTRRR
jgi:hypothetical protein